MRHLMLGLGAVIILVCSTPVVEAQRDGVIGSAEVHGQVRYTAGGAPAERVLVRVERYGGGLVGQALTDSNGAFRFPGLEKAQYTVTVRATGYREAQLQINLKTSTSEYVVLQLAPDRDTTNKTNMAPTPGIVDANVPPEAQKEFVDGRKALLDDKKIDEGRKHLEKALSLYPNFLEAQLLLGTALMEAHDWGKAEAALRRAIEINPKAAQSYFALGEVYRQRKRYQDAEKVLLEGLKLDDRAWQGHFTLCRVYFASNDLAKAGVAAGRALQLKPDLAEGYLLAGNILLRARKAEDALPMFEEYLRLAPKGESASETSEVVTRIKRALSEKK
jgi:cytochrome c-type biogenesis protein CcmH/NrfG